jgi:hypothetical protein
LASHFKYVLLNIFTIHTHVNIVSLHHHYICHNFCPQNNSNLGPVWKWRDNDWRLAISMDLIHLSISLSLVILASPPRPSPGISVQNWSIYGMCLKKNWLVTTAFIPEDTSWVIILFVELYSEESTCAFLHSSND